MVKRMEAAGQKGHTEYLKGEKLSPQSGPLVPQTSVALWPKPPVKARHPRGTRMFAPDTNLTLSAKTLTELKLALTPELNNLSCWLKANKLSLNVAKTELMIIGSRQRLSAQCDDVEIRIDDQIIKRVDHTKSLGLTIDVQLSWGKHVEEICKKISSVIGALKRVRFFIFIETASNSNL